MTKADLERVGERLAEAHTEIATLQMLPGSYIDGFNAALELLWPCVQQLQSCERYLDLLGYIPADSRQRSLSEELWETAMFERDSAHLALSALEEKIGESK